MDYNQYQSNQNTQYPRSQFSNPGLTMASVSLFLGIGTLFTSLSVFLPMILGCLAIVFALLSKGYGKKMLTQAKVGFGCGLAGLSLVIVMLASTYVMLFSNPDMLTEIGQQYDAAYEDIYGQSMEDELGISFEDMLNDYADMLK